MKNRQDRRGVPAMVNVRGLPCVLPDNMLSATKRVMSRPALTRKKMNAGEVDPTPVGAAERDRRAERAPGSVCGWGALTSILRVVDVRTAMVVIGVTTAVADGNVA
jgi:hypothetical protein